MREKWVKTILMAKKVMKSAGVLPSGAIEMKRLGNALLAILALLIFAENGAETGAEIIKPGDGIDLVRIGQPVPEESVRKSLAREQIFVTSENNVVTSVLILNPAYRTREGVRVGDTFSAVSRVYGSVEVEGVSVVKGDYLIGNAARVMKYSGVSFYLTKGVVSAIAVHGEQ